MISKHTLSTTASNQKYSEENYQTVTRRKYLHFSLNQLIDAEILLMKIHLLVNFNVWKSGLDIPVSRRVSIWNPTKNCHFGLSLDHQMCIFLCSSLNGNSNLIEPKSAQPNECL